jgi:hypothetical protein
VADDDLQGLNEKNFSGNMHWILQVLSTIEHFMKNCGLRLEMKHDALN